MPSVFAYSDYRTFLSDWYAERRKRSADYSYRKFSEQAGLASPNYFALVVDGSRNLTVSNIHQFATAVDLRGDEIEYFESMVLFNQAKTATESAFYQKRLQKLRGTKPDSVSKRAPDSVIKEWYYTATLVLAHGRTVEGALKKVQTDLRLGRSEAKQAIEELIRLRALLVDGEILSVSAQHMTVHDPKSLSALQKHFLFSQLKQSLNAFKRTYSRRQGRFLSHTLTVPPGALDILHDKFRSWIEELTMEMDMHDSDENTKVAQINIQLFHPQQWAGDAS